MERHTVLATAGAVVFFAGTALAADNDNAHRKLPERNQVTLSGTVEKIKSNKEFTLRDNNGSFDVTVPGDNAAILNEGDSVSVTGSLAGATANDIEADSVRVHRRADL